MSLKIKEEKQMKKFLKVIPIILILALVFAITVSANATSFNLGTRQYYSKSATVYGNYGNANMWVKSDSSCNCRVSIFGFNSATSERFGWNDGTPGGAQVFTGKTYNQSYTSWYGYMQPLSSSGLGGVATGNAVAE